MKAQAAHARFFYVASLGLVIRGVMDDNGWLLLVSSIVMAFGWFIDIDGERERVDREVAEGKCRAGWTDEDRAAVAAALTRAHTSVDALVDDILNSARRGKGQR